MKHISAGVSQTEVKTCSDTESLIVDGCNHNEIPMEKVAEQKTSEFGKGFIYNFVLFACHIGEKRFFKKEIIDVIGENEAYCSWFNAASDHLRELYVPTSCFSKGLIDKIKDLKETALGFGHGEKHEGAKEAYIKCVDLVKEIALLIDKENGVEAVKADYE